MAPKRLNANKRKPRSRTVLRTIGQVAVACVIQLIRAILRRKP